MGDWLRVLDAPDLMREEPTTAHHQLVDSLRDRSFAVVRFPTAFHTAASTACSSARSVFARAQSAGLASQALLLPTTLVGYSQPSQAKELFRLRLRPASKTTFAGVEAEHVESLVALFALVEACLRRCTEIALSATASPTCLEQACARTRREVEVVGDAFHYYNADRCRQTPNCSQHVDRGLLVGVVCAEVPGLQLRCPHTGAWVRIEGHVAPLSHVVVMVSKTLEELTNGELKACVHRVGKASAPRISLSCELRLVDQESSEREEG